MLSATNSLPRRDLHFGLLSASCGVALLLLENLGTLADRGDGRAVAALGLAALCGGAAGARRTQPLAAGVIAYGAYQGVSLLVYSSILLSIIAAGVVGLCAVHTTRWQTVALGLACAAMAVAVLPVLNGSWPIHASDVIATLALAVIPVVIGDAFRSRQALAEEAIARAARAERLRELELARALDDERLRIARDVHDIVGHHLSAISIQAGVGDQRLGARDEAAAGEALRTIRTLSSTALAETRRSLRLARDPVGAPLTPAPSLANLDGLVETARSGGVDVTLRRSGAPQPLPEVVELCAYRVVQEALTNVVRHADVQRAGVLVSYRPEHVELRISDDGAPAPAQAEPPGHGLAGMRERVSLVGGTVVAGPRSAGGWEVVAQLPLAVDRP